MTRERIEQVRLAIVNKVVPLSKKAEYARIFECGVAWADENPVNPWISVKEKMPPIKTRVLFLDNNGKAWLGKNTISGYAELESDQPEILPPPTVPTCKPIITHWMPIPSLKRDEEDIDDPRLTEKQKKELGYK